MVDSHLTNTQDGTKLDCFTNANDKPVLLLEPYHIGDYDCDVSRTFIFTSKDEIEWLIKQLQNLKDEHFGV